MSLPSARNLPAPIPADQLADLLGKAGSTMGQLIVALIAIHGLGKRETTRLCCSPTSPSRPGASSPAAAPGSTPSTPTSSPAPLPPPGYANAAAAGP